jgi:hypothetical protein
METNNIQNGFRMPYLSKLNWNKSPIEYLQTGQHVPNTKTALTSVIS